MGVLQGILNKLGLQDLGQRREPLRVMLLDDDVLRHEWFAKKFKGDALDTAIDPARAVELLRRSGRQAEHVPFHLLASRIKNYRGR